MKLYGFVLSLLLFSAASTQALGQQWVDTVYNVQIITDVPYGSDVDAAGNIRILTMDICMPVNDNPPLCGRPLLVAVHGGAFMAGTKNDAMPHQWMIDFAKRGYTTASINYRLGMIQTSQFVNCNISAFNLQWNCFNVTDTLEWYRAWFRGVQDAKGAIRFLVANASSYNIDPRNVFIAGESAGAIITLGAAFLDDESEKPASAFSQNDAQAPNLLYESSCVQLFGLDTSVASMNLTRPDLGSVNGSLNSSAPPYLVKGVGAFYGGMFYNLFQVNTYDTPPALYMFHQPNDLIVPYGYNRLLSGYAYCATSLGCQYIISRPFIHGSEAVRDLTQQIPVQLAPEVRFDSTLNAADCTQQALSPSTGGHQPDSYSLRSLNMAKLFATRIDTSSSCGLSVLEKSKADISLSPDPLNNIVTIRSPFSHQPVLVEMFDVTGRMVKKSLVSDGRFNVDSPSGFYIFRLTSNGLVTVKNLVWTSK